MALLRNVVLLFAFLVTALFATPGNLIIDNSVPLQPDDTLIWSYGSNRDSVWSLVVYDNGDGVYDSAEDPVFYPLLQVDNDTTERWFDGWGVFPDKNPVNDSFLYVLPKAELAAGLYWIVVKDQDGAIVDSVRGAPLSNPYRTISGTITVGTGTTASAAFVPVVAYVPQNGDLRTTAITDSLGGYTLLLDTVLGTADAGKVIVKVDKNDGRLPSNIIGVPADTIVNVGAGNVSGVDFELVEISSGVRVTLTSGGLPIPGIGVGIRDSATGQNVGGGRTDDSGRVTIYCMPGPYRVEYSREDLPPNVMGGKGKNINVMAGQITEAAIAFTAADTVIRGHVTQMGAAPGGVYMMRLYNRGNTLESQSASNPDGSFALPASTLDTAYYVMFDFWNDRYDSIPAGYMVEGGTSSRYVRLGDTVLFNFIIKPAGAIKGTITNNSHYSASLIHFMVRKVDSTGSGTGPEQGYDRSSTGPYLLDGIKDGDYVLSASLATGGGSPYNWVLRKDYADSTGKKIIIAIRGDTPVVNITFTDADSVGPPMPQTRLSGRVAYSGTLPLNQGTIELIGINGNSHFSSRPLSDSGDYDFNNFPTGWYRLVAYIDPNHDRIREASTQDTQLYFPTPNQYVVSLTMTDVHFNSVSGFLVPDSGLIMSLTGAFVSLSGGTGGEIGKTTADSTGRFTFDSIPDGSYHIKAAIDADSNGIPEFIGETNDFQVSTAAPADSVIVVMQGMPPADRSISGTIVYTDPWPSTGRLHVRAESMGGMKLTYRAELSGPGPFTIDSMFPDDYMVSASADSLGIDTTQRINFADGMYSMPSPSGPVPIIVGTQDSSRSGIQFEIRRHMSLTGNTLSGSVAYSGVYPRNRILVLARDTGNGPPVRVVPVDSLLRFNMSGLPNGSFTVEALIDTNDDRFPEAIGKLSAPFFLTGNTKFENLIVPLADRATGTGVINGTLSFGGLWPESTQVHVFAVPVDSFEPAPRIDQIQPLIPMAYRVSRPDPGAYSLTGLPPGYFVVVARAESLWTDSLEPKWTGFANGAYAQISGKDPVLIKVGVHNDTARNIDVALHSEQPMGNAILEGTLSYSGALELDSAVVLLFDAATDSYVMGARPDTSGLFQFDRIEAGTYRLLALIDTNGDEMPEAYGERDSLLTVDLGDTIRGLVIPIRDRAVGTGSISGVLSCAKPLPAETRFMVVAIPVDTARPDSEAFSGSTKLSAYSLELSSLGAYSLTGLPDTTYLLLAVAKTLSTDSNYHDIARGIWGTPVTGRSLEFWDFTPVVVSGGAAVTGINITLIKDSTPPVSIEAPRALPTVLALGNPSPNPFNPATTLAYDAPKTAHVTLTIYDISGRHVRTLVNGMVQPGYHRVHWNASSQAGRPVASGIYVCRMTSGKFVAQKRLILLK